ncbi:MAG: hypothetical protein JXC32_04845, partial [Anaerolineae bacterium]|nr:hypothetical protein [Anaerolineae bacterium]
STQDAQVAAGRGGTDAHLLHGRGDFLAITSGDHALRFQVAQMTEWEAKKQVGELRPALPALTMDRAP